jgi:PhnB protein
MAAVRAVPDGYSTVTPYLVIKGAAGALDWYRRAFGAQELARAPGPDGRIMHAEMRVGETVVMMCDEFPEMSSNWRSPLTIGGTTVALWVYVEDCDSLHQKAVDAGANNESAPADMFWGDRLGRLTDPFGHSWMIATHKEDVPPEEMDRRQKEYMTKMAG